MDKMLYIAAGGAHQTMMKQSMTAHNLANASTTGFKKDLSSIIDLPINGPGFNSRVAPQLNSMGTDFSSGTIISTGNELDMAINGDGFIVVQDEQGGEAFTRAGNMHITPNGLLQTSSGNAVVGNGGPISIPPAAKVEIGADGTISIRPLGEGPKTSAIVDRIKLVKPDFSKIEKGGDGLLRMKSAETVEADATVQLIAGSIESSNVSPMEEMVKMINMARQFEMQMKMMNIAQELESASTQMMRFGQ